ncbi:hypothetical protein AUJ68_04690 [Candidatus Woesearchaeota archaeon CG1_02_57_44]|nr:MAG: hypothetical protein AUJ68_04690 [Candidatus Woesearchaeota archaeon CG1_02_57_44]
MRQSLLFLLLASIAILPIVAAVNIEDYYTYYNLTDTVSIPEMGVNDRVRVRIADTDYTISLVQATATEARFRFIPGPYDVLVKPGETQGAYLTENVEPDATIQVTAMTQTGQSFVKNYRPDATFTLAGATVAPDDSLSGTVPEPTSADAGEAAGADAQAPELYDPDAASGTTAPAAGAESDTSDAAAAATDTMPASGAATDAVPESPESSGDFWPVLIVLALAIGIGVWMARPKKAKRE